MKCVKSFWLAFSKKQEEPKDKTLTHKLTAILVEGFAESFGKNSGTPHNKKCNIPIPKINASPDIGAKNCTLLINYTYACRPKTGQNIFYNPCFHYK